MYVAIIVHRGNVQGIQVKEEFEAAAAAAVDMFLQQNKDYPQIMVGCDVYLHGSFCSEDGKTQAVIRVTDNLN